MKAEKCPACDQWRQFECAMPNCPKPQPSAKREPCPICDERGLICPHRHRPETSAKSEAREWWIYTGAKGPVVFIQELTTSGNPGTHVIEYSAYEKLKRENAELLKEIEISRETNFVNFTEVVRQRDELKTAHAHILMMMEKYCTERDKLQARVSELEQFTGPTVVMRHKLSKAENDLAATNAKLEKAEREYQELYEITHEQMNEDGAKLAKAREALEEISESELMAWSRDIARQALEETK